MNEIISQEQISKWWRSFAEQLKSNGLDPDNPYVLANIMVDNKKNLPLDSKGGYYEFRMADIEKKAVFQEFMKKREELFDPFSYAFMERKDGKYVQPRPEKGGSVEWMFENMKKFNEVTEEMQRDLFQMARENRLVLKDPTTTDTISGNIRLIKVNSEGKALITPTLGEIIDKKMEPGPLGFSSQQEMEQVEDDLIDKSQSIETSLKNADSALMGLVLSRTSFNQKPTVTSRREKFIVRQAILANQQQIEKMISILGTRHPDWLSNNLRRTEAEQVFRCACLAGPTGFPSERVLYDKHLELFPILAVQEARILKITGCQNMDEVMRNGMIKHIDGTPFPITDEQSFARTWLLALASKEAGLRIVNKEEQELIYSPDHDNKLQEGILWEKYGNAFHKLNAMNHEKAETGTPEHRFDAAFQSFMQKVSSRDNKLSVVFSDVVESIKKLDKSINQYMATLEGKDASALTPAQVSRKKLAETCSEISKQYMEKHELAPELLSENSRELLNGLEPKAPEAQEKEAPKDVSVRAYQQEMARLYKDLLNTDHKLSKDTKQYNTLKAHLNELFANGFQSMTLARCYSDEMNTLIENVNLACKEYMDSHKDLPKLSSRQQKRLKIMHRMMDLTDSAKKAVSDPKEERMQKLAGKLIQNRLIQACGKGTASLELMPGVSGDPKKLFTDHNALKTAADGLKDSPKFRAFCEGKDLQKLLETNGEKLYQQFGKFTKNFAAAQVQAEASQQKNVPSSGMMK